jgi:hypothetical protein
VTALDEVEGHIEAWLEESTLRDLVVHFDSAMAAAFDTKVPLSERLEVLDRFTDGWDTRQGKERNEAEELVLTSEQSALALTAADQLGLRGVTAPKRNHYDHLLILGGLVRACVARPRWAARLVDDGLSVGHVTALGGHRKFRGDEFTLAAALGMKDVDEEFVALEAGTRQSFGLGDPYSKSGETSELVGGSWTLHRFRTKARINVDVAAAPSSEAESRRANTADSYAWFATTLAHLKPEESVLMVTTSIYVPAQHAAAMQMLQLPYGAEVETVGFEPGMVDPLLEQTFTPTKYLLEIRSTVRAFRRLLEAASSR